MSFEALRERLPDLGDPEGPHDPWPTIGRGGVSFSDDLMRADGRRLGVRVRVTDRPGGGYLVDLRDSDPRDGSRFALGEPRARVACLLALGHALGRAPSRAWSERLELRIDPDAWVGAGDDGVDAAALAFGMARTADALLGALANAWPGRVGAASGSLGAVVELGEPDRPRLTEVLPGGEGGRPDRAGADAWPGLVLPSPWPPALTIDGLRLDGRLRDDSGGLGKHPGGRGVVRTYQSTRPLTVRVAFDRTTNPPHGIDRAGPPAATEVWLYPPGGDQPHPLSPWEPRPLLPGARLEVLTGGGAGWGFPGYGDIEWDPREWFGSSAGATE